MYITELNELIEGGENSTTEFKRRFSSEEKIAKELIAFANSKGGKILFGIDDDGTVFGVESEKGEVELVNLAANFYCEPPVQYFVEIKQIYRKDVVVVIIPESSSKPHRLLEAGKKSDEVRVYIRLNDKSVLASKETVKVLKNTRPDSKPLIFNLEDKEKYLLDYLSKNEKITLQQFRTLLNLSNRRASRILVNLVRANLIRLHTMEKEDFYTLN